MMARHRSTCAWHDDPDEPQTRDGRECGAPCWCHCIDGEHAGCWCDEHAAEFYGDDDEQEDE